MAVEARDVVLLAGKLASRDEGVRVCRLVERLSGHGIAVRVICGAGRGTLATGPGIIDCPGLARPWQRPWTARRLRLGDGASPPELIHVLGAELAAAGLALADRWGVPYVLSVDEFIPPGGRLRVSRCWCRALLAAGRDLADDLRRSLGVPADLVAEVPLGLVLPDRPCVPCDRGRVPVVGSAGPLVADAGLATFLDAARRVINTGIDAEFVIAGQGRDEPDLRRRAERMGIAGRVTFAGEPAADGTFWRVLDIFCQPALEPTTGRSLAIALAAGVPSIASDVAGLRALVPDDSIGLRVPPGDPDALARSILTLLGNAERARGLGRQAHEWVARQFDPAREATALVAAYRRALLPANAPAPTPRAALATPA